MPSNGGLAGQRTRCYFGTGERDSGVEHLIHLSKLSEVKGHQFTQGHQSPPALLTHRHTKRQEEMEKHIRNTNTHLFEKLQKHNSLESRRTHGVNLVPIEKKKTFFQGSNLHARELEANKIDEENYVLMNRLSQAKPFASNKKLKKQQSEHDKMVKRISRFKPQQPFAGAELIFAGSGRKPQQPQSARKPSPRQDWQPLLLHDVKHHHRYEDNKLRHESVSPREHNSKRLVDKNDWCNREIDFLESQGVSTSQSKPTPRPPPRRGEAINGPTVYQQGGVYHQLPSHRQPLSSTIKEAPAFVSSEGSRPGTSGQVDGTTPTGRPHDSAAVDDFSPQSDAADKEDDDVVMTDGGAADPDEDGQPPTPSPHPSD